MGYFTSDKVIVHFMTQDNQPYGSARMCCEECGTAQFAPGFEFTSDRSFYAKLPPKDTKVTKKTGEFLVRCSNY